MNAISGEILNGTTRAIRCRYLFMILHEVNQTALLAHCFGGIDPLCAMRIETDLHVMFAFSSWRYLRADMTESQTRSI